MTSLFREAGNFQTSAPNDLQMTLKFYKVQFILYVLLLCLNLNFQSFSLHGNRLFELRTILWPNALNDPEMTLNTTRSNVNHPCVTSIHEFQISICLTLRPPVFEIQFCDKCTEWPRNDLKPYQIDIACFILSSRIIFVIIYWYIIVNVIAI